MEIWSSRRIFFNPSFLGSKNDFCPDDQISTWLISATFKYFLMIFGAKDIYFLQKFRKSTSGQHLGIICCLNIALKTIQKSHFCDLFWCNKTFKTKNQYITLKPRGDKFVWIFYATSHFRNDSGAPSSLFIMSKRDHNISNFF